MVNLAGCFTHLRHWPFMNRLSWLFLACAPLGLAQSSSLPAKETLTYNIEWRLITAGTARLEWAASNQQAPPGFQIKLRVESVGLVSKLFKVEDDYNATLNQALCTESLEIAAHEGSRRREIKATFDGERRKASYLERDVAKNVVVESKEIEVPDCVHDVVGGIAVLRTLTLEPGQTTEIPVSDGKKSVMAKVEAQQREDVKSGEGTYKTIRYEIFLFNNVLYRRAAHLYVWLSDDRRKLPVQIRVRMPVTIGTITLQLSKHE